jgi:hypothetical protein
MRTAVSHRSSAVLNPLSTFVMEVLPWAASGAIGLYLLWATCLAPGPGQALTAAEPSVPAFSSLVPATQQSSAVADRTFGIAALPDLKTADQPVAHSM